MKLTDSFDDIIYFEGREIRIRAYFDVVLKAIDLVKDDLFSEIEKWEIMAEMFAENPEELEGLSIYEKAAFAQEVLNNYILDPKSDEEMSSGNSSHEKFYDLSQDADYIYASFLFDYNMDLIEQQGKLHWKKFKALLNALSEKTKFREVINIRMCDLPKDPKERAEMLRLKQAYALNKEPMSEKDIEDAVAAMDRKADAVAQRFLKKGGRS
ncbi:Gp15 family bacteriophage protein [Bacillus vallismortis]|uniref:Gp15 family bacteriophage protein n=1 Tax=Bacillus vallismortis TaxID=72361 RepID=UPI000C2B41A3|nr:Gp15 family bacteriophage protein [Bacillus vallismortis]PJZ00385.1 hypothetical protein CPT06_11210 [Bacillus vallismortis]